MSESETLHEFLVREIAELEGIEPNEVTQEWLMDKREKEIYPSARWETCSELGGYNSKGLSIITQDEVKNIMGVAQASFSSFIK